jgi:hypothetical protein
MVNSSLTDCRLNRGRGKFPPPTAQAIKKQTSGRHRNESFTRFAPQYNTEIMPEDDVDKFLTEQKAVESKRHELIKEVLRQKEAAIKAFDEKLAKLGYDPDHAKRSHHRPEDKKTA